MHRHGGVAEHGLGPCGRHGHDAVALHRRVTNVVQLALLLGVHHLEIGQCRPAPCTPVHDVLPAIDQPLSKQGHEDPSHGPRQVVIEREPLPTPIDRRAERPHLAGDGAVALPAPLPDTREERFAAQLVAVRPLLDQLFLDDVLGSNAGVVGPGQPQHVVARHPLPTADDVRQRLIERMPDMQHPGDVGRRQDHAEDGTRRSGIRAEGAGRLPEGIPLGVDARVFEPFRQLTHTDHGISRW